MIRHLGRIIPALFSRRSPAPSSKPAPRAPARAVGTPLFSVLVPSRNRGELLQSALLSVLRQDFPSFEIIVSDNASDEPYHDRAALSDPRVVYSRSETPLWVTANWNRALEAARGEYVVMLGDDDALAPGYFAQMQATIERFNRPDIVYCMAYHYCYSNVSPAHPDGYFATVDNSPVYQLGATTDPFPLPLETARSYARRGIGHRHEISFNAQHFLYKREFITKLSTLGAFYQSPYPDFYACFVSLWKARSIIVDPSPRIIIGISPRSFGYYFQNNRQDEGNQQFLTHSAADDVAPVSDEVALALRLSGSAHVRNWLLAALQASWRLAPEGGPAPNLRRYRRLQIFEMAHAVMIERTSPRLAFWQFLETLDPVEQRFAKRLYAQFLTARRLEIVDPNLISAGIRELLRLHLPARVTFHKIGVPHRNIDDAVAWLEQRPGSSAPA